jgi:folylpolyglutamate synthase/dihydropteroate synthase
VCGYSKGKDIKQMLTMLANNPVVEEVYPVSSDHFRLMRLADLQNECRQVQSEKAVFKEPFGSIDETLSALVGRADSAKRNILVCGTFFIMKDVRRALGYPYGKPDWCDEDYIN